MLYFQLQGLFLQSQVEVLESLKKKLVNIAWSDCSWHIEKCSSLHPTSWGRDCQPKATVKRDIHRSFGSNGFPLVLAALASTMLPPNPTGWSWFSPWFSHWRWAMARGCTGNRWVYRIWRQTHVLWLGRLQRLRDAFRHYGGTIVRRNLSPQKCHGWYEHQSYHHACHAGNYHILWVFNGLTQGPHTQCSKNYWRLLPICDSSEIILQLSWIYI